ncbi:MAG TPA: right-handed parallel beta-helix repeat-containing protein [Planctomycetota bacterium]|nr:right-handed parallel beta-helix repeat-containing protein [Planctomycetota bacterium]
MKRLLILLGVLCVAAVVAPGQENVVTIDVLPFVCDKAGTYRLAKDLSAVDSGILILSNDVVIDLGGHTLTYGTGEKRNDKVITYNSLQSGNVGHHAVYVTSDPRRSKDAPVPAGWNYRFTGVVIRNGRIKTGGGGISYSDAIDVSGTVGCEITGLTIENAARDSSAVIGGRQSRIHHCTIIDTNTHVSNRHAQLAVIVTGPDTEVSDCTIRGGAQVGIKATSGAHIHHNDIRHSATATNCYGIQGYGQKNVHAHHNLIIPTNGRGLHISEKSVGWRVHHNYIEARERANREYPKGLDTHGIKMEGCRDAKVWGNVVVCESTTRGNPTPLNFSIQADSNNEVYGNVFVAKKVTPKERATAVYLVGGDGTGTVIRDNVFFSNDRMVEVYWEPGNNFTLRNCRFYPLAPEDKITTFFFWNAKPARGLKLLDCTFGPGVGATGYQFPDTKEDWSKDAEYTVGWTVTLRVTADGKPVPGAKVTAVTTKGVAGDARVYTTDADGEVPIGTRQFTIIFHSKDRTAVVADDMPYSVKIDGGEAGSHAFEVTIGNTSQIDVDLKAKTHTVTPRKDEPAPDLDRIIAEAKAAAGAKP